MSKLDQYMQGRTEGMEFALRLAKDKGIEELEKEVRFRNRTGVSLNLTRQEIAAGSDKIKNMTFDTMLAMWVYLEKQEIYTIVIAIQKPEKHIRFHRIMCCTLKHGVHLTESWGNLYARY